MKECDIFFGGEGHKRYSDPSYIFSWGQDPTTHRIYATDCYDNRVQVQKVNRVCLAMIAPRTDIL